MNNNFIMSPMNSMYSKPMPVSAGKIYPADQPMVFNSQNPNAPPIYPCGVCHKEVHDNDQAILCESGCNFWFHRMGWSS
uniref:Protein pygopus-like n=1 Tax=Diabrotica virgifera virgifera TaxID=50390 RepID=A0A6P7FBZ5_DIAVI